MREIQGWGVDREPTERPGVPMEHAPESVGGAHWEEPARQAQTVPITHRYDAPVTAVFGTAQPPKGLSGRMRRAAYRIPEWRARHWLLLLAADRVDAVESAATEALRRVRASEVAARLEHNPMLGPLFRGDLLSRMRQDAARKSEGEGLERPPALSNQAEARLCPWDMVDEASWESFPASDPPAAWAGRDLKGELPS